MKETPRRKKFVDARVQGALALRLFCHWFAFVVIAGVSAFILQFCCNPLVPPGEHFQQMWAGFGPMLLSMLFLLPVFVFDTIKLSHRFAGPVLRLRSEMRKVARGETPQRIKFRKNDFWHDLAEDYNSMLDRFSRLSSQEIDAAGQASDQPSAAEVCGV